MYDGEGNSLKFDFLGYEKTKWPTTGRSRKKKKILSHCNLFQKLNMISFRLAETISRLRNIVNVSQFFLLGRNRRTRKGRNRRKSWHRCKFIFLSLL